MKTVLRKMFLVIMSAVLVSAFTVNDLTVFASSLPDDPVIIDSSEDPAETEDTISGSDMELQEPVSEDTQVDEETASKETSVSEEGIPEDQDNDEMTETASDKALASEDSISGDTEFTDDPNGNSEVNATDESFFTWNNTVITGYTGTDTDIVIPKRATEIAYNAFQGKKIKSLSFEIGSKMEKIGINAFYYCELETLQLPDSLIEIGNCAFFMNSLKSVTLPANLKKVGGHAFGDDEQLEEINYNTSSIDSWNGSVFYLNSGKKSRISKVTIGSNVRMIPHEFMPNVDLKNVNNLTIPAGVTEIGVDAFCDTGLKKVTFEGNNLKKIGVSAFESCPLSEISLPSSVSEIEIQAFLGNKELKKIVLPKSLKKLKTTTFMDNTSLEKVAIYKSTEIEVTSSTDPFKGCNTNILTIYGYKGSPAEKFAGSKGYTFKSIDEWEGGNPYGKPDTGPGEKPGVVIIEDGGQSGLDPAVNLKETGTGTYITEMVKGQKYTFGKGKGKWKSSAPSVVRINPQNGAAQAKSAGKATLTEEKTGVSIEVAVYEPVISGDKKLTMYVAGDEAQVSLGGLSGSSLNVAWTSSNYEIAAFEANGQSVKIKPAGKGTATVAAHVGGKTYPVKIVVKDSYVLPVLGTSGEVTLNVFQSSKMKFSNGLKIAKAVWTEENGNELTSESVVSVKNGKLLANRPGSITIKGTDGTNTSTIKITVLSIPARQTIYINKGRSKTYKNTFAKAAEWSVDNSSNVAASKKDGQTVKLTAYNNCKTVLTCVCRGVEIKSDVVVDDPTPAQREISLSVSDCTSIGLKNVDHPVNYSSNKKNIAFVDENGMIYGRKKGKAKISALVNGQKISVKVTVQ